MNTSSRNVLLAGAALILVVITISVFRLSESQKRADRIALQAEEIAETTYAYNEIKPDELRRKILSTPDDLAIVDVRSPISFVQEHITRSTNLESNKILSGGVTPAYGKSIVVVIFSAEEALPLGKIVDTLKKNNTSVVVLSGGFEAWKAGNYPTISVGDPTKTVDIVKVSYTTIDAVKAAVDAKTTGGGADTIIIDVRPASQYMESHIPYAVNVPLADLENATDRIPASKKIIVYGLSVIDGFRAGVQLYDLNFPDVLVVDGGLADWVRAGNKLAESTK